MPTITIKNLDNKSIPHQAEKKPALILLHENQVDWMHACGGKGRCTTCKMIVHEGEESLTAKSPFEKQCSEDGRLDHNERLACQCQVKDDLVISVPESGKLPHVKYS